MSESAALLRDARGLMTMRGAGMHGRWPRAAALLGRQALEHALDAFWNKHSPGVVKASRHAQLLCLSAYLDDAEVVRSARYAWHGLSRACHHHVYELPPTAGELEHLLAMAERLVHVALTGPTR